MQHCIIGAFLRFPPIQKMRPDTLEAPCQACCLQRRCDSDVSDKRLWPALVLSPLKQAYEYKVQTIETLIKLVAIRLLLLRSASPSARRASGLPWAGVTLHASPA